eukprot:14213515-Ditylum_brightwellii.AAC.1
MAWMGFYGQGAKVCVLLVAEALAPISKTCKLNGQKSPVYKVSTIDTYTLLVQRCIMGMRWEDPPSIPQLALPVSAPIKCHRMGMQAGD